MNASYTYEHMEYPTDPNSVTPTSTRNKYLFEVTWFSKLVTLILLLTLPVLGFVLGLNYNFEDASFTDSPLNYNKQIVNGPPVEHEFQMKNEQVVKEDFDFQTARENIEALITTEATDASQCKTIAFGDRACGGPEEFLIYSTLNTDVELLKNLVSEYNYQAELYNVESGAASICSLVTEPKVGLSNGECVVTSPGQT